MGGAEGDSVVAAGAMGSVVAAGSVEGTTLDRVDAGVATAACESSSDSM